MKAVIVVKRRFALNLLHNLLTAFSLYLAFLICLTYQRLPSSALWPVRAVVALTSNVNEINNFRFQASNAQMFFCTTSFADIRCISQWLNRYRPRLRTTSV